MAAERKAVQNGWGQWLAVSTGVPAHCPAPAAALSTLDLVLLCIKGSRAGARGSALNKLAPPAGLVGGLLVYALLSWIKG